MDHGSPFLSRRYIGWTINLNLQVCPCIRETSECSFEDCSALYACMRMYIYIFENGSLFSGGSMLGSKWFSWKKRSHVRSKGIKIPAKWRRPFFKRTLTTQCIPTLLHISNWKKKTSLPTNKSPLSYYWWTKSCTRLVCIKPCKSWDFNYQPQLVIAGFLPSTVSPAIIQYSTAMLWIHWVRPQDLDRRLLPDESWQHLSCDDRCMCPCLYLL